MEDRAAFFMACDQEAKDPTTFLQKAYWSKPGFRVLYKFNYLIVNIVFV